MTDDNLTNRRKMLKMSGTALIGATAGCTSLTGGNEFKKQKQKAAEAAEKYDGDLQQALDDGFRVRGPWSAGSGYSLYHPERRDAISSPDDFDLSKPQGFKVNRDGEVGAVFYRANADKLGETPDLFADENADATEEWQTHEAGVHFFATGDGSQTEDLDAETLMNPAYWSDQHPPSDLEPGDSMAAEWGPEGTQEERVIDYMAPHPNLLSLYVWVGHDNSKGLFAGSAKNFGVEQ